MNSTRNPGRVAGFLYLLLSIAGPIKPKTSPRGQHFPDSRSHSPDPYPESCSQPKNK